MQPQSQLQQSQSQFEQPSQQPSQQSSVSLPPPRRVRRDQGPSNSFRQQIWVQARRSLSEQPDIHARLMSRYPQVPEWWYLIIFVPMFIFGAVSIEVWHTQMPIWALVLALIIGA